ncbi:MAG: hypothetical protein F6K30_25125 [Cyanothece sp. SIO2G6]|nr:hypothetical protein [Cyanothece sp. SIO2G6]
MIFILAINFPTASTRKRSPLFRYNAIAPLRQNLITPKVHYLRVMD